MPMLKNVFVNTRLLKNRMNAEYVRYIMYVCKYKKAKHHHGQHKVHVNMEKYINKHVIMIKQTFLRICVYALIYVILGANLI